MITKTTEFANEKYGKVTRIEFSDLNSAKKWLVTKNYASFNYRRSRTTEGWVSYISVDMKSSNVYFMPTHFVLVYQYSSKDAGWYYHEEQGISLTEVI
jgi:hypothetical protein